MFKRYHNWSSLIEHVSIVDHSWQNNKCWSILNKVDPNLIKCWSSLTDVEQIWSSFNLNLSNVDQVLIKFRGIPLNSINSSGFPRISLHSSGRGDFEKVINLIGEKRIDPSQLISKRVSLNEFPTTFQGLKKPGSDLKVIMEPSEIYVTA